MKISKTDHAASIAQLREWLAPGDTIYLTLASVSRSGMSRTIVPIAAIDGRIDKRRYLGYHVARVLGWPYVDRVNGVKVSGCGMDMGFHLVETVAYVLYRGTGYKCLGPQPIGRTRCPSNYHANHRNVVSCEDRCYVPGRAFFGPRDPLSDGWPMRTIATTGGETIDVPATCTHETAFNETGPYLVCPRCNGAGEYPNPNGPERFDLVHYDGYALRSEWL